MNRTLSISPDVNDPAFRGMTFDQARDAYEEQVRGLIDGGVDLLLLETIFDTLNAKAAIVAIENVFEEKGVRLPLMISVTITDRSGRTLSGQTLDAFYTSIRHARPFSVGLNCALGARDMRPYLAELARMAECYVSCYPNAGLPNAFGQYDELPEETAALLRDFAESGFVNILGGCCGTTPDHIAAVGRRSRGLPPQAAAGIVASELPAARTIGPADLPPQGGSHERVAGACARPARTERADHFSQFSGLETLTIRPDSNFQMIGERTNVTGSARFARLIKSGNYAEAVQVARRAGPRRREHDRRQHGRRHARLRAGHDHVPELHRDRAGDRARAGHDRQLEMVGHRGRAEVRAGQGRRQLDQPEGRRSGLPAQGAAGQALRRRRGRHGVRRSRARRTPSSARSRSASAPTRCSTEQAGFDPTDIIFDPNILAIATGLEEHNDYAVNFIEATRIIKATCPGVKISGGVSNLSFSFRGNDIVREAMHSAFLFHAIKAGMDMGIVNAGQLVVYEDIPQDLLEHVEDVIFNRRPDATERLVQFADTVKGAGQEARSRSRRGVRRSVEARLSYALVHGVVDFIEQDVEEARQKYAQPLDDHRRAADGRHEDRRRSLRRRARCSCRRS